MLAATMTANTAISTSGGTTANAPNLTITGSDASALTFTAGSWFNSINFGTTTSTASGTVNINNLFIDVKFLLTLN